MEIDKEGIAEYFRQIIHEPSFENFVHASFFQLIFILVCLSLLRPLVLSLYSKWLPPKPLPSKNDAGNKSEKPPKGKYDWLFHLIQILFDGLHYFWALTMILITIPYTRMEGAIDWNCYWSWVFQTVTTCLLLIPYDPEKSNTSRKWIRYFTMLYWLYMANGVMSVANFGYVYYRLAAYSWPYLFVHFAPPLFIWLYVIIKIGKIDVESMNPLCKSFFLSLFSIMILPDAFQYWYGKTKNILKVYSLEGKGMPYLQLIGAVAPFVANFSLMVLILCAKVVHVRLFGWNRNDVSQERNKQD